MTVQHEILYGKLMLKEAKKMSKYGGWQMGGVPYPTPVGQAGNADAARMLYEVIKKWPNQSASFYKDKLRTKQSNISDRIIWLNANRMTVNRTETRPPLYSVAPKRQTAAEVWRDTHAKPTLPEES